jgi:hypothetical protein
LKPRALTAADLYTALALFFGAIFIAITPPFGVSDETTHYERAYEVATGAYLGGKGLPAGMQAFIDDAFGRIEAEATITAGDYARWGAIPLEAERIVPYPDPMRALMRGHYPGNYAHLAPAMAAGVALGLSPMAILYLMRAVSLIVGVALVRQAIRIAPASFQAPFAFLALSPTSVVFFGAINVDSALIGLAFLWVAFIASLAARPNERLTRREIAALIALGVALGQYKTGYLLMPTLALILPSGKFSSLGARLAILAAVMLPGAAISLYWAATAKSTMLGELVYSTAPGNRVAPREQTALMLAEPLRFLGVLANTLLSEGGTSFMRMLALGGWSNIPLGASGYALVAIAALLVFASGEKPPRALASPFALLVQAGIVAGTTAGIMAVMYIGWTGVGAPVVNGFQGRYWIPVAPLLLAFAPVRFSLLADRRRRFAFALVAAVAGLILMAITVARHYFAG